MPKIHFFMAVRKKPPEALHAWLIMLKTWQSKSHDVIPTLLEEGLGESDFRVLEVLLYKGAMSVNAIGPKVDLNPGSVSVALDRLLQERVCQPCREQPRSSGQNGDAD